MSGHSKWSKIKRKKGANDAKRGAVFTKLIRKITLSARDGGGDLDTNFALRLAVGQAKTENMPSANIGRAIKRGTGEISDGGIFEEVLYEAIFPDNFCCVIKCTTDNKNRTVSEVRKTVEDLGGSFVSAGSVLWQFEEKGSLTTFLEKFEESEKHGQDSVPISITADDATLEILEIEGVEDISPVGIEKDNDGLSIVTSKDSFQTVGQSLSNLHYHVESMDLAYLPLNVVETSGEQASKIVDTLEELDDVDKIWGNG